MNAVERDQASSVTLDQLLALNDEIAALARAGIPLERGLTQVGQEAPGKLGVLASRLADRLKAGESLAEIVKQDTTTFPPVWRSVVLAGLRSGHLAGALESLSRTGRRAMELRRSMALALVYPLVVVTLAYGVFLFSMTTLVPALSATYEALTGETNPVLSFVVQMRQTIPIWGVAIPLVCLVLFCAWWIRTGRRMRSFRGGSGRRYLFGRYRRRRFPSVRQTMLDGRIATFAEVLGLLDQHDVPLPEAIILAADASGDRGLSHAARAISVRMNNGEVFQRREDLPPAFPPLLGWSIVSGSGRHGLQRTLATSAEAYRQRALDATRWAAVYLPMVLTVVIGGSAVLGQALVIFLPFVSLLYRLGQPLGVP